QDRRRGPVHRRHRRRRRLMTKTKDQPAPLPPVTVAKLEAALQLTEQLASEHRSTFIANGQAYKDEYREASRRPLNTRETARLAAGLGAELADTAAQIDEAGLTAYDEPEQAELLLAAGIATGPAFMRTAMLFTALMEMSDDDLEQAESVDALRPA